MHTTENPRRALLTAARAHYDVPEAHAIDDVVSLLAGYGASVIDFAPHEENLIDEFVNASLLVGAWTITDVELLESRATGEEHELFAEDPDEVFDPNEYGEAQAEWTTWAHELDTLKRLIVLLERDGSDPRAVGNFRVHGAGQWLRESLWAATGVVPRDPGAPGEDSALFGRGFELEGREAFVADPLNE